MTPLVKHDRQFLFMNFIWRHKEIKYMKGRRASFCWKFKLIDQISSLKSMNYIAQELKGIFFIHSFYVCFLNQIFALGCNVTNV